MRRVISNPAAMFLITLGVMLTFALVVRFNADADDGRVSIPCPSSDYTDCTGIPVEPTPEPTVVPPTAVPVPPTVRPPAAPLSCRHTHEGSDGEWVHYGWNHINPNPAHGVFDSYDAERCGH